MGSVAGDQFDCDENKRGDDGCAEDESHPLGRVDVYVRMAVAARVMVWRVVVAAAVVMRMRVHLLDSTRRDTF